MSIRARLTLLPAVGLAILALAALPGTSEAQFGKRLKDAVKRTAEDKAIQKATEEESKAIDDAVEGGGEQGPGSRAGRSADTCRHRGSRGGSRRRDPCGCKCRSRSGRRPRGAAEEGGRRRVRQLRLRAGRQGPVL